MSQPWFRSRPPEQGGRFDIVRWQGAVILAVYALLLIVGIVSVIATGASAAGIAMAALCHIGGTYWLVRMVRAHGGHGG